MNEKQLKALKELSKALLACKRAHILIRGQSDSLNAWCDLTYTNVEPARDAVQVETHTINHHGVYIDSGADDQLYGDLRKDGTP